jgi:RimJ/RimL family protein N-acetyltransferase
VASSDLPVGDLVSNPASAPPPQRRTLTGRHVALTPLVAERDAHDLYQASHGSALKEQLWTYMARGPFEGEASMSAWLRDCEASADPLFLTVRASGEGAQPVGMVSFLNVVASMRRLELGNIWYTPAVQRTKVNTEAAYLLLTEAFDVLGYRRVEWKCDALNARSRAAAIRLGFQAEGSFRQHMIIKGRNRDTAWFAMTDGDWTTVKPNLERWLATEGGEPSRLPRLNAGRLASPGES